MLPAMDELFSYVPPDDERGGLTVTTIADRCTVVCTWSYEGVGVDLTPAKARELGQTLISWAASR